MTATAPASSDPEPSRGRRGGLSRRLRRGALALSVLCLAWFLLGAVAPLPSTLMLWRHLTLQPVERIWTPLEAISPALVRAVIAAEDQRFCRHRGVDWGELRDVLDDEGGPSRGASTIAMQTVKNVYLWHGPSVIRKALELPLALAADLVWRKRRVMEVYLNVAEWGEGVFGAEAASRRYFRKGAGDLTPREAAQLAAALPNPALRRPDAGSARARANSIRIGRRAAGLGSLADCVLREGGGAGERG